MVKCLTHSSFSGKKWSFQQDSASAHKAKVTQEWLSQNVLDVIKAEDWPSGSPDLNLLDYKLWSVMKSMACYKKQRNLDLLRHSLVSAVKNFPIHDVRKAIDEWPQEIEGFCRKERRPF